MVENRYSNLLILPPFSTFRRTQASFLEQYHSFV
jgi:hypothetical protein